MRGDKLVDGRDLAREEETQRAEDESVAWRGSWRYELGAEQELQELPANVTTQHEDKDHRALLLGVMRAILEGQKIVVQLLQLPPRELIALEALQGAVRAKDSHLGGFVYASDRRDMLEQALGVLQPTLLIGTPEAIEMGGDLEAVMKRVGELRTTLVDKEDAQDELIVIDDYMPKLKPNESDDDNVDDNVVDDDDVGGDGDGDSTSTDDVDAPKKRSTLGHEDEEEPSPSPSRSKGKRG